jgi:hypothetical protein
VQLNEFVDVLGEIQDRQSFGGEGGFFDGVIVELAQDNAGSGLEAGCGQQKEETDQHATAHYRPSRTGYIREHGRMLAEGLQKVETFRGKIRLPSTLIRPFLAPSLG